MSTDTTKQHVHILHTLATQFPDNPVYAIAPCSSCGAIRDVLTEWQYKTYALKGVGSKALCRACYGQYYIDNPIPEVKGDLSVITGWNRNEQTFAEYCGKESLENDREALFKVPMSREDKKKMDEIKNRGYERAKS